MHLKIWQYKLSKLKNREKKKEINEQSISGLWVNIKKSPTYTKLESHKRGHSICVERDSGKFPNFTKKIQSH